MLSHVWFWFVNNGLSYNWVFIPLFIKPELRRLQFYRRILPTVTACSSSFRLPCSARLLPISPAADQPRAPLPELVLKQYVGPFQGPTIDAPMSAIDGWVRRLPVHVRIGSEGGHLLQVVERADRPGVLTFVCHDLVEPQNLAPSIGIVTVEG